MCRIPTNVSRLRRLAPMWRISCGLDPAFAAGRRSALPATTGELNGGPALRTRPAPRHSDEMLLRNPIKIVQNAGVTFILYEQYTLYRQVFTDGRPPSPGVWSRLAGYSIGKWEGDWFVVDRAASTIRAGSMTAAALVRKLFTPSNAFAAATSVTWMSKSRLTIPRRTETVVLSSAI